MKMFSATERLVQRLTSWKTVLTPAAVACIGPVNDTGSPSRAIAPSSVS